VVPWTLNSNLMKVSCIEYWHILIWFNKKPVGLSAYFLLSYPCFSSMKYKEITFHQWCVWLLDSQWLLEAQSMQPMCDPCSLLVISVIFLFCLLLHREVQVAHCQLFVQFILVNYLHLNHEKYYISQQHFWMMWCWHSSALSHCWLVTGRTSACKNLSCHVSPKALIWNKWRKKTDVGTS